MIGVLQKKFVRTAMVAVTVLLIGLLGGINIVNTVYVFKDAFRMADMLSQTGGLHHGQMRPEEDFLPEEDMFSPERGRFSMDHALSERFFLVFCDEEGTILRTDIGQIYAVDEEEALELAGEVLGKDREKGIVDDFLYVVSEREIGEDLEEKVIVFLDISDRLENLVSVALISLVFGFLAWVLMLLLVRVLSRRAIAPIAANMERQKQFVTNAGHELKTPLAIILANTDALELYTGESKWTRNIRTQTQRLSGLMQNLLTLSRMDEIGTELPLGPLDFTALVGEKLKEFAQPAQSKGIALVTELAPVTVKGNRETLAQLLGILLDNAVKYTPEGGRICLRLGTEGGRAVLRQSNTIREEEREEDPERLFDRFYRADKARTQKTAGGYGIGLSAARALAQANRGEIGAVYEEGNNIVFTVKLMI